jgi:phosphoribosylformimino-5-aminoimidazole carboxamide ribotide isomerase
VRVIPVIDILNGIAVHAIRGQRSEYKPLQSILTASVDPLQVAQAFQKLGFSELYIADLDAIIACKMTFPALQKIATQTGLRLMVDAGVTGIERARHLLDSCVNKLIIGTETLQNMQFIQEAVELFNADHVVVSLDLKGGKVITNKEFNGPIEPFALLENFKKAGVKQIIVLDLSRVGSGKGVDTDFLKRIIIEGGLDVYVGGGVRNVEDLKKLNRLGIKGALVATALHNDLISIGDLKKEGFLN